MLEKSIVREEKKSPNSRLSSARERQILAVAQEILLERGLGNLTMDEVARRAKCSKATLYRRWRDKTDMVIAIVGFKKGPIPDLDKDSLRENLLAFLGAIVEGFDTARGRLFLAIASEMQTNQDLADAWARGGLIQGRKVLASIVDKAKARGEISGNPDLSILHSIVPGTFVWALYVEKVEDREKLVATLVDHIVLPFLNSY